MVLRFFFQLFFLYQNALFKYTGEQTCEIFTGSPILPQHFFLKATLARRQVFFKRGPLRKQNVAHCA